MCAGSKRAWVSDCDDHLVWRGMRAACVHACGRACERARAPRVLRGAGGYEWLRCTHHSSYRYRRRAHIRGLLESSHTASIYPHCRNHAVQRSNCTATRNQSGLGCPNQWSWWRTVALPTGCCFFPHLGTFIWKKKGTSEERCYMGGICGG